LIQAYVNELRGGPTLESTGETALEAARVIDQILSRFRSSAELKHGLPESIGAPTAMSARTTLCESGGNP
jgi:hypothetical protein